MESRHHDVARKSIKGGGMITLSFLLRLSWRKHRSTGVALNVCWCIRVVGVAGYKGRVLALCNVCGGVY